MKGRPRRVAVSLLAATLSLPLAAESTLDQIELVSRVPFATGEASYGLHFADERQSFSADGRYLAWNSSAGALVAGVTDLNGRGDVFLTDLETGATALVSHRAGAPSRTADGGGGQPMISADGRYVAFASASSDLVGGASSRDQVYLYDRVADTHELVTHAAGGAGPSNRSNKLLAMSADGRYLAIESDANDLVAGVTDPANTMDIYLWDRQSDAFQLVTHQHDAPLTAAPTQPSLGGGYYGGTRMSADGRYLVFPSSSGVLVAGDGSSFRKVFLFDRQTGANSLVSQTSDGEPVSAEVVLDLTSDGRFALYWSAHTAADLVPGATDSGGRPDLFLFDRATSKTELISRADGPAPTTGNDHSIQGWVGDDGQSVYFTSEASNLVAGVTDTANSPDLFLRDLAAGTTTLLSRSATAPAVAAHVGLERAFATGDGASFTFSSDSPALVAGMIGDGPFVFRYDRATGQFALLSHADGSPLAGLEAEIETMAADGDRSLWTTREIGALAGAVDPQVDRRAFVAHERSTGSAALLNRAAFGGREAGGSISAGSGRLSEGARLIAFNTASRLCAAETPSVGGQRRVCLLDREADEMRLISHRWDDPEVVISAADTRILEFSSDDRRILMQGSAPQMAPNDENGDCDLFLYDLEQRTFELISHAAGNPSTTAEGDSCQASVDEISSPASHIYRSLLSDDASKVVFTSLARNLVTGAEGPEFDVYLRDRTAGTTVRLGTAFGSNQPANASNMWPEISGDGRVVTFFSQATNLIEGFIDGNAAGGRELFLFDLSLGTRTLVSRSAASPLRSGNGVLHDQTGLSTNGQYVAFTSLGSDHAPGVSDANKASDVYLFDRASGANTLVSHAAGQPLASAAGTSYLQDFSPDGRYVLFQSTATDLVTGVSGRQLYRWDRADGSVRLVSHRDRDPGQAVGGPWGRMLAGGRRVLFTSDSAAVVPGVADLNAERDLFVWDAADGSVALLSRRLAEPAQTGNRRSPYTEMPQVDASGAFVLFSSTASDLVPHDGNGVAVEDYFLAILGLFGDGFESGDTSGWTSSQP